MWFQFLPTAVSFQRSSEWQNVAVDETSLASLWRNVAMPPVGVGLVEKISSVRLKYWVSCHTAKSSACRRCLRRPPKSFSSWNCKLTNKMSYVTGVHIPPKWAYKLLFCGIWYCAILRLRRHVEHISLSAASAKYRGKQSQKSFLVICGCHAECQILFQVAACK